MGSAASKQADPFGDLLRAFSAHCTKAASSGADPDIPLLAGLLADALHDPKTYEIVLTGLAKYLSSAVQGGSPRIPL